MRRLVIDPRTPPDRTMRDAADVLRAGGVVAFPTDTFYGLAVDPRSDAAVTKLFDVKGRASGVPVALIACDARQAEGAGEFGDRERRLAARFWPGPLTIVVPAAPGLSPLLSAAGTVGVRVPAHGVARSLAAAAGGCITATSANRSGGPPAVLPDDVAAALGDRIDLLIDGGRAPGGPPSTVVEFVAGRPTLHRAGAVAWERVLESLDVT
jgi:L-threonylcarbamoyladenylate synthase